MSDVEKGDTIQAQVFGRYQDCEVLEVRSGGRIMVQPLGTPDKRRQILSPDQIGLVPTGGEAEPEPAAPTGDAIEALEGNVGAVADYIASVDDADVLDRLAELESAGDDRKGVHEAIAARRKELAG